MVPITAVLLDINQTQLKVGKRTWPAAVALKLGVRNRRYLKVEQKYSAEFEIGLSAQDRMRLIASDLDRREWLDRIDQLVSIEEHEMLRRTQLYPGVVGTLIHLKNLGLLVGHCSNGNPYGKFIARRLELLRPVDGSVFSYEVGSRKPDPPLYVEALRRIGAQAETTVFVGDGSDDELAGAGRLGLRTVQVHNPGEKITEVRADYRTGRFAALPLLLKPLLAAG